MADYNLVQLESIYFTDDGLVTGIPCRIEVDGLDGLLISKTGSVATAADGTPYAFIVDNGGQGAAIRLRPLVITDTVLASIQSALDAAASGNTTVSLDVTGDLGTFNLECIPAYPKPIEGGTRFSNGRIYEVVINLIIQSAS